MLLIAAPDDADPMMCRVLSGVSRVGQEDQAFHDETAIMRPASGLSKGKQRLSR
jgi:hypothetical protein